LLDDSDDDLADEVRALAATLKWFGGYFRMSVGVPTDDGPMLKLLDKVRPVRSDDEDPAKDDDADTDKDDDDGRAKSWTGCWLARRGLYWTKHALECLSVHRDHETSVPATVAVHCLAACAVTVESGLVVEPLSDRGLVELIQECLSDEPAAEVTDAEILAGPPSVCADWRGFERIR
jgi:hypothetical protein